MDAENFKEIWDNAPEHLRQVYKFHDKPGVTIEVVRNEKDEIIGRAVSCSLPEEYKKEESIIPEENSVGEEEKSESGSDRPLVIDLNKLYDELSVKKPVVEDYKSLYKPYKGMSSLAITKSEIIAKRGIYETHERTSELWQIFNNHAEQSNDYKTNEWKIYYPSLPYNVLDWRQPWKNLVYNNDDYHHVILNRGCIEGVHGIVLGYVVFTREVSWSEAYSLLPDLVSLGVEAADQREMVRYAKVVGSCPCKILRLKKIAHNCKRIFELSPYSYCDI